MFIQAAVTYVTFYDSHRREHNVFRDTEYGHNGRLNGHKRVASCTSAEAAAAAKRLMETPERSH